MGAVNNATPLIALDAVVIDTETTGLDPAQARMVEFGALRLVGGRLDEASALRRLINPGVPIPAQATQIHRIDDAAVAEQPKFAELWPEFSGLISGAIVVGHAIGFDLAVIRGECERAKLRWQTPRTLDTRLLAQVIEPNLGGYTIEHLAAWLGIAVADRHSALADARTSAKIFLALLPKLREGNIRTLAEAEQACLSLTSALDEQHRAGWVEPVTTPTQSESAFIRIDPYPYRLRIADLMNAPVKSVRGDVLLSAALKIMAKERISSLLIELAGQSATSTETGIITERDVLRVVSEHGADALHLPVGTLASRPLITVPAKAFVYVALARMSRLKLRHLGVEDENGRICGIITSRDLLRLRAQEAVMLGDVLGRANSVAELAGAWARLPRAVSALLAEEVTGNNIAEVISRELGALTRQAARLAEAQMQAKGHGEPPCAYAVCVLGSAGRGESLLALDQDNAIVFADGEPGGSTDRWFAQFGSMIADILHEVGVPYCKGGVMAKNEQWRGSVATWHERIAHWISRSNPADLLSVDIFFDLVGVHGDMRLANDLWRAAFDAARDNATFAKLLAEASGGVQDGLNMFGGLRTDQGRIDLKMTGLFGVVTTARVLAIRHHLLERSTPARLAAIAGLGHGTQDIDALTRAHALFLDLILAQQIEDIAAGLPPSNKVAVKWLTREQRARLKQSLAAVRHLDALTRDLLF